MSLPPEPLPPSAVVRLSGVVVESPPEPTANVQCPAVTTTVPLARVPEHVYQPPGSG